MDTAKAILERSDLEAVDAMAPNERYAVSVESADDLVFEKVGPDRLSVSHRRSRNGICRRDPEIVFRIEGEAWIPIEYTRHPAVHRYDATGLDVSAVLTRWSERLRRQGFLEATVTRPPQS